MTDMDPQELVSRYMAVWNQPDATLRRKAIHELWAEDGAHILQPPQDIRKAARGLGFASAVLEARGHDALEVRVTRAYEDFVASGVSPSRHGTTQIVLTTLSNSTGKWFPSAAARWQAPAWRSWWSARTAASKPTISSSRADMTPRLFPLRREGRAGNPQATV